MKRKTEDCVPGAFFYVPGKGEHVRVQIKKPSHSFVEATPLADGLGFEIRCTEGPLKITPTGSNTIEVRWDKSWWQAFLKMERKRQKAEK